MFLHDYGRNGQDFIENEIPVLESFFFQVFFIEMQSGFPLLVIEIDPQQHPKCLENNQKLCILEVNRRIKVQKYHRLLRDYVTEELILPLIN